MPTAVVDPFVLWSADIVDRPVRQNDRGVWVQYVVEGDIALHKGTVYIGSPDNKVYAFDANTGERLWTFNANGSINGGIAVDEEGETIFFGTDSNGFFAVNTDDGTEAWHWEDKDDVAGDFPSVPTLVDELVIAGSSAGRILAWDQDDNALEWAFPRLADDEIDEFAHSGFANDNHVYFGNEDGTVYVREAVNGGSSARTLHPKDQPYQKEQGCHLSQIPDDADCDRPEEISSEFGEHKDGIVFGNHANQLYLWPVPRGLISWVYEANGDILGDIAVQDNNIIFAVKGGTVVAIDTDERRNLVRRRENSDKLFDRMKHAWIQSTEQEVDVVAGPVVSGNSAFWIDRRGKLYAYTVDKGRLQFQMSLWTGECRFCTSKPAVHGNILLVTTADGFLKAIRLPD